MGLRGSYYGGIVLDGLVFHIDAAKQESYAKRGLRYMQNGNSNMFVDFADTFKSPSTKNVAGTIIDGATFSNFTPYHRVGENFIAPTLEYWHDTSNPSWMQSAGIGTFYGNIEFDGVNDYVNFGNTPEMTGINEMTVSVWFYVNKFSSGNSTIVSRFSNTNPDNGWELFYDNQGVVHFTGKDGAIQVDVTSNYLVEASNTGGKSNGGWYNAVGTVKYYPNDQETIWSIYVAPSNIHKDVSTSLIRKSSGKNLLRGVGSYDSFTIAENDLHLGKSSIGSSSYMNGRIMQLSVYNRALSLEEININFEAFSKRIFQIDGITNTDACPGRIVVFQICNENAYTDDNFDIYLNDTYIGAVFLGAMAQVGSIFIADLNPALSITSGDFACPLNLMVTYRFDPSILKSNNTLEMRNTQNNGSGNLGTIGIRNYQLSGNTLSNPCVIADLGYSPSGGGDETLSFSYTQCCSTIGGADFITKWDTSIYNDWIPKHIEIPINNSYTYNYDVDWGDGNTTTGETGNATHTYAVDGIYTVKITGTFPAIRENGNPYSVRMTEVSQWGTTQWLTMNQGFYGCLNMNVTATDVPDLSLATDISFIFTDCLMLDANLSGWDVSTITDMSFAFYMGNNEAGAIFNNGSSPMTWNTAAVQYMQGMFWNLTSFNADITSWNTANVLNMSNMFNSATSFNQPISRNGSAWNTLKVTDMSSMFSQALDFNQNIGNWNTGAVTLMSNMFSDASAFNNGGAANTTGPAMLWDTSKVIDMSGMFASADVFNADISSWNTILVNNMYYMFQYASKFNINIGGWNTSAVTFMAQMFYGATSFNQYIGLWNTAAVTNMVQMFYGATSFNNGGQSMVTNVNSWNTSNVTAMSDMFSGSVANPSVFNQNIGNWNTIKVTSMNGMFANNINFNQNIGSWNTAAVTNMTGMFNGASAFNLPLVRSGSSWNTSNVVNMAYMFSGATAFNQNIGNWQVGNVLDLTNFMDTKTPITFSTTNLNAIYNGWSTQTLKPNLVISFGTAKYTSAATAGRNILIGSPKLWQITDGGI